MSYITAVHTANPDFCISPEQSANFSAKFVGKTDEEKRTIRILQRATGIKNRFTVLEDFTRLEGFNFFPNTDTLEPFPSTAARLQKYEQVATQLACDAAKPIIEGKSKDITHLITVSCTGMFAPGLDIELVAKLNLPTSVHRTAINFMGCYAAFNALKVADAFCKAFAKAKVLIVGVELCSLHFQKVYDEDNLLANAIFADGAAAVLVENEPTPKSLKNLKIEKFYCDLAPKGKDDMAWYIRNTGFEMRLSSYVADILSENIQQILQHLTTSFNIDIDKIPQWAIHPGGKKILEAIAKTLSLEKSQLETSYHIWENYGNMSSVTVLFVLQKLLYNTSLKKNQLIPSLAFGPGLTIESALFSVV